MDYNTYHKAQNVTALSVQTEVYGTATQVEQEALEAEIKGMNRERQALAKRNTQVAKMNRLTLFEDIIKRNELKIAELNREIETCKLKMV